MTAALAALVLGLAASVAGAQGPPGATTTTAPAVPADETAQILEVDVPDRLTTPVAVRVAEVLELGTGRVVLVVSESVVLDGLDGLTLDRLRTAGNAARPAVVVTPGDGSRNAGIELFEQFAGAVIDGSRWAQAVPLSTATPDPQAANGDGLPWPLIAAGLLVVLGAGAYALRPRSGPGPAQEREARPAGPDPSAEPLPGRRPAPPPDASAVRRKRRPAATGGFALPSAGVATVRSDFHPDGYVEIDSCLLRARWADKDHRPPAAGEPVRVRSHGDHLLAFRASGSDGAAQRRLPRATGSR